MGAHSGLYRCIVAHMRSAIHDLRSLPARREAIRKSYVRAGKDRQKVVVYTDREGSMAITRVKFNGETEWFALMEIKDGELDVKSGYGGGFLRMAGSGATSNFLKHLSDRVEGRKFKRMLMESR